MRQNMNVITVWAWMLSFHMSQNMHALIVWECMLWFSYGLEYGRSYRLGMDALVPACTINMGFILVRAWVLWFSHSPEHGRYSGLDILQS